MQFARKLQDKISAKAKTVHSQARRDLALPHEHDRHAMIISSGLVALYRNTASSGRRLVALRYPGEVVQPHESSLLVHSLIATEVLLTDTTVFVETLRGDPEMSNLARVANVRAQLIAYEWLTRDAMDCPHRTAHFLCEHAIRRNGEHAESLSMELIQAQIGEITAQTSVNVNRVLGRFEKEGIFVPIGDREYRADWPELRRLGRFEPRYLDCLEAGGVEEG